MFVGQMFYSARERLVLSASGASVRQAADLMSQPHVALIVVWAVIKSRVLPRIPVVDPAGMPIGILYARDALPKLLTEAEDEEKVLCDYVINVG